MITSKNIIKEFMQFEQENGCFEREVNGIRYWHLIRGTIILDIINDGIHIHGHPDLEDARSAKKTTSQIHHLAMQVAKSRKELHSSKGKRSIAFLGSGRKGTNGNQRRALQLDGIVDRFQDECVIIERPIRLRHEEYSLSNMTVYSDYIEYRWLLAKLTNKWGKLIKAVWNDSAPLVYSLDKHFGVNLDEDIVKKRIEHCITGYQEIQPILRRVFAAWETECVIEICHYDTFNLVANKVLHEMGIPTIELQHGTIGASHYAYNLDGNHCMDYLPDIVATFGQYWIDQCDYPNKDKGMVACGYPHFEEIVSGKSTRIHGSNTTVLFISQPGSDVIQDFAIKLAQREKNEIYHIVYKLHPSETQTWTTLRPELKRWEKEIVVIDSKEADVYDYLSVADYVIGTGSTVVFEAVGFDASVLIVEGAEGEAASELVKLGLARFVGCVDDFLEITKSNVFVRKSANTDYLWRPHALDNIEHLIRSKIEQN